MLPEHLIDLLNTGSYKDAQDYISEHGDVLTFVDQDGYTLAEHVIGFKKHSCPSQGQILLLEAIQPINVQALKNPHKVIGALLAYFHLQFIGQQYHQDRSSYYGGSFVVGLATQILKNSNVKSDELFETEAGGLLECAVITRSPALVAEMIKRAADVIGSKQWSPHKIFNSSLAKAVNNGFFDMAQLLIDAGADVKYNDNAIIDTIIRNKFIGREDCRVFLESLEKSYDIRHKYELLEHDFIEQLLKYSGEKGNFWDKTAQKLIQQDVFQARGSTIDIVNPDLTKNLPLLTLLLEKKFPISIGAFVSVDQIRKNLLETLRHEPQEIGVRFLRALVSTRLTVREPNNIVTYVVCPISGSLWQEHINDNCHLNYDSDWPEPGLIGWAASIRPERPADVIKKMCSSLDYSTQISAVNEKITHYACKNDFLMAQNLMCHDYIEVGYLGRYMACPSISWWARWKLYSSYRNLSINDVCSQPLNSLSLLTIGVRLGFQGSHAAEFKRAAIVAALAHNQSMTEISTLLEQELSEHKIQQGSWWVRFLAFVGVYTPETPDSYLNAVDAHSGETVLTQAVKSGKTDIVKELCQAGADFSVRNNAGRTAWEEACDTASVQMTDLLRELGAAPLGQEVIVNNDDVQPSDSTASMLYSPVAPPTTELSQRIQTRNT